MCGLSGFIGNKKKYGPNRAFLNDALLIGTLRGMDSTGIVGIQLNTKKELFLNFHKRALWGPDFLQLKQTEKVLWAAELYNTVLIHHRAGTTGDINDENAHPYWIEHIIGAHNGTLNGAGGLDEYSTKDHTDSWNIFNNMAHLDEMTALKSLCGAYVLTWVNTKDKTFNIARNDMRPLACLWEEKEEQMYWASEAGMLRWITDRNSIDTEDKMWEPKELTWYKFPIDEPRKYEKIPYAKWEYKTSYLKTKDKPKSVIRETLDEYGLKIGDKIVVKPDSWLPMPKRTDRGHILCLHTDKDFYQTKVILYDQSIETWNGFLKHKHIEVAITAARIEDEELKLGAKFVRILPDDHKEIVNVEVEDLNPPAAQVVYGPAMRMITREKWHELTSKGCSDCGDKFDILDHKSIRWTNSLPMCPKCWHEAWLLGGEQK